MRWVGSSGTHVFNLSSLKNFISLRLRQRWNELVKVNLLENNNSHGIGVHLQFGKHWPTEFTYSRAVVSSTEFTGDFMADDWRGLFIAQLTTHTAIKSHRRHLCSSQVTVATQSLGLLIFCVSAIRAQIPSSIWRPYPTPPIQFFPFIMRKNLALSQLSP